MVIWTKYFAALLIYLLYMTTVILFHMFYSVEIPVVLGMSLFAIVSFALILADNMDNHLKKEHQIALRPRTEKEPSARLIQPPETVSK